MNNHMLHIIKTDNVKTFKKLLKSRYENNIHLSIEQTKTDTQTVMYGGSAGVQYKSNRDIGNIIYYICSYDSVRTLSRKF